MNKPSGKPYVQFSKRIVVAVTASVTAICLAAMILCTMAGDTVSVVLVVKAYISYAIVVFAAYSGNSAVEKWLVRIYKDEEGE
jgi:hypothetical protein